MAYVAAVTAPDGYSKTWAAELDTPGLRSRGYVDRERGTDEGAPPAVDKIHPSAAASLREGLAETLSELRLDVPPILARTLRSANAIESMISICRSKSSNVKHWRDGQMALRWCAAGMVEAGKQFRRVNGHLHLPALRAALEREARATVGPLVQNDLGNVA